LKTFFAWCTQYDTVNKYRDALEKNIFSCMEMAKQSYPDTVDMPVKRFQNYLKWKSDLEEDKQKALLEEFGRK
jgi:hypothetical protein